jgi:hypothetical protein
MMHGNAKYSNIASKDTHATIEELSETLFSMRSVPSLYGEYEGLVTPRVEVVSNTATVALRIVEGDEKGTRCPGV